MDQWEIIKMDDQQSAVIRPHVARMDFSVANAFEPMLFELIDAGFFKLVVDMEHVRFLDSCMLGCMVDGFRRLKGQGWIRICNPDPNVRSVLKLTRLCEVFPIFESLDEAMSEAASA